MAASADYLAASNKRAEHFAASNKRAEYFTASNKRAEYFTLARAAPCAGGRARYFAQCFS